ncbi:hypothetical protein FRC10_005788, partial [Ceratobasidium sp. 414]
MSILAIEDLAAKFLPSSDIKTSVGPEEKLEVGLFTVPEGANKLEAWTGRIKELASPEGRPVVRISPIKLEEVEDLERELSKEGFKFRFDWDAKSSTALIRMPKLLHSAPLSTWASTIMPEIQRALDAAAVCGKCTLMSTGDSQCRLQDGSRLGPDAGFAIYDNQQSSLDPHLTPRVVFESALSQSSSDVLKKAWKYLFKTHKEYEVHAVVLCHMENPPPWSGKKMCRLTLEVWVREETGDIEIDFPLDNCPPASDDDQSTAEEGEGEEAGAEPSPSDRGSSAGASSSHATWSSNEATKTNDQTRFWFPDGEGPRMWRRNDRIIVVYDEAHGDKQNTLPDLEMDTYDFLRTCNTRPHQSIPAEKRVVSVGLEQLRKLVQMIVQGERDKQRLNQEATPQRTLRLKRPREAPTSFQK